MAKPRRIDPEVQLANDLVELMGYPAFHRFLFTVIQKSGIGTSSYGTEVATSYCEGRRSLGLDLLRLAEDALPVRSPFDGLPFAAMAVAIGEATRSQLQEVPRAAREEDEDDDVAERR